VVAINSAIAANDLSAAVFQSIVFRVVENRFVQVVNNLL
jgi:hypothetical protein